MKMSRTWAMPNHNTLSIKPIAQFAGRYALAADCIVDPFARDSKVAHYTNDLNPDTAADYHMDAVEFLKMLHGKGVQADLVIFDPPYSLRQVKECYDHIGHDLSLHETNYFYKDVRDAVDTIVPAGGIVLSFGWNTIGLGKARGYEIEEIMLVCHGGAHNDTICMAERKQAASGKPTHDQPSLFSL